MTAPPLMIVCHCRNITCSEIHDAIDWMRQADPDTLITPGKVYRVLGTSADCGGCLPLFLQTMRGNENLGVGNARPPVLKGPPQEEVRLNEGRR